MVLGAGDAWAGYARTVVEIDRGDRVIVVRALRTGPAGEWPWTSPDPIHILTAWDPGAERPGLDTNRQRQALLVANLCAHAASTWPARGTDPVTGARDEGVAVRGLDEVVVRGLGARYGQDAIFAWSPDAWAIVACAGTRRVVCGWVLGVPP